MQVGVWPPCVTSSVAGPRHGIMRAHLTRISMSARVQTAAVLWCAVTVVAACAGSSAPTPAPAQAGFVITNGLVVDGTGSNTLDVISYSGIRSSLQ